MMTISENLEAKIYNQTYKLERMYEIEIHDRTQRQNRMYGIRNFGLAPVVHVDDYSELLHDLRQREKALQAMLKEEQYVLVSECLDAYEERGVLESVSTAGRVQYLTLDKALAHSRARRDIPNSRAIELYEGDKLALNESVTLVDSADWKDDAKPTLLSLFEGSLTASRTLRYLRSLR